MHPIKLSEDLPTDVGPRSRPQSCTVGHQFRSGIRQKYRELDSYKDVKISQQFLVGVLFLFLLIRCCWLTFREMSMTNVYGRDLLRSITGRAGRSYRVGLRWVPECRTEMGRIFRNSVGHTFFPWDFHQILLDLS